MKSSSHLILICFCFYVLDACNSQPTQNQPLPLRQLNFTAPNPAVQAELLIPYREGETYGICNYEGKVLLKPQFEEIEMPLTDLGYFKARKNGRWSLYDIRGEQVLPCDYPSLEAMGEQAEMTGREFIDDSMVHWYLTKIKDARSAYLKSLSKDADHSPGEIVAVEPPLEKPRYFFLHKNTRQPFQSWFLPDYQHLNRGEYARFGSGFSNTDLQGFLKVMTEDRLFTLLDHSGNPVVPPNWNCASISPNKIIFYQKNGFCAVRDLNTGSQTDFLFHEVLKTANPRLCLGKTYETGNIQYYKIDAAGKVDPLPNEHAWMPLNERYSVVLKDPEQLPWTWLLLDEQTGKTVRELPSNKVAAIYPDGVVIRNDDRDVAVLTVQGDTLPLPPYPNYTRANDALYIFFDGDDSGIANFQHQEIFRQTGGKISYAGKGSFRLEKDQRIGWVGPGGQLFFPPEYDQIRQVPATNSLLVTRNGLSGLFDARDGRELLPVRYHHLRPNGITAGQGAGFEVREGKDFYIFTPDLSVILQQSDNPVVKKSAFVLKNAPEAAVADFEKAPMPRFFTPYVLFSGPNWLHIFQCDGKYITSLEGFSKGESLLYSRHQRVQETDGAIQTGVARVEDRQGKTTYIRLADGFVYQR